MFLLFAFIGLLLVNCANDDEQFVFANAIELSLTDSSGNDLLNPETPNSIDITKIKLFYLVKGQLQEINDPTKDYPRNYFVYHHENNYRIRIFLNPSEDTELLETVIKWSDTDADTIIAAFKRTTSTVVIQKIWINEKPFWTYNDKSELYFHLVK